MNQYWNALGPTVRKLIAAAAFTPIIYIIGVMIGLPVSQSLALVLGLWLGMAFPDLDVFTGWIRTTFQTMLLILLLIAAIIAYPSAWGMLSNACPAELIGSVLPGTDTVFACRMLLAALLGLAAYILAWLGVSWVPGKNSFHSWPTAVMLAGGIGLLNRVVSLAANPWPITAGFGIGYALHIIIDGKLDNDGRAQVSPMPKNAPPIMKYLRF